MLTSNGQLRFVVAESRMPLLWHFRSGPALHDKVNRLYLNNADISSLELIVSDLDIVKIVFEEFS